MQAPYSVWIRFMETPLVHFEDYGVSLCSINALEASFGLYVKNLRSATFSDLQEVGEIGPKRAKKIQTALQVYWEELVNENAGHPARVRASTQIVRQIPRREISGRGSFRTAYGRA